jgi:O-antigen/teichoic acid export membrane protein
VKANEIAGRKRGRGAAGSATTKGDGSLSRSALIGTSWLLAQNVGTRVISFGSQIILAKLLAPSDFGNIGLALTITTLANVVANFGVDDVLLQRQNTLRFWASTAFVTSLCLGLFSFIAVVAIAPFAVFLYRSPVLLSILPLMALSIPLTALSTVPTAQIRARLDFRFLATYTTAELAATQLLTIGLAVWGFGVYSFVIPAPLMALLRAVAFWLIAKPKLGRVRLKLLRLMGSNSAAAFGQKLLTAAVSQGDYFVLGLVAAKPVIGAYFFAFRLAIQPVQLLAGNLTNVLFPILAQLRYELRRQREAALNASRMLAFMVMPYCFLQAAVARPVLNLVFGTKWQDAIPLVEILSIGLAFDAVSWVAGALLLARGEFRTSFVYSCISFPIFFGLITLGAVYFSALGVAVAVSIFYVALAPIYSYSVFRKVGVSRSEVVAIYLSPVAFAAVAALSAVFLSAVVPLGELARTIVIGIVGSVLYLVLVRLFVPSTFHQLIARMRAMVPSSVRKVTVTAEVEFGTGIPPAV